jgi:hypothetical protein
MSKASPKPNPGQELASAVALLAAELRQDREETGRNFADLTGAIREQGAQIKALAESNSAQWENIGEHRREISKVRAKADESAQARSWSKETRSEFMKIAALVVVLAGFISGPIVTFVKFQDDQTRADLVDRLHVLESALDQRLDHSELVEVEGVWRDRVLRIQGELAARGESIDLSDLATR